MYIWLIIGDIRGYWFQMELIDGTDGGKQLDLPWSRDWNHRKRRKGLAHGHAFLSHPNGSRLKLWRTKLTQLKRRWPERVVDVIVMHLDVPDNTNGTIVQQKSAHLWKLSDLDPAQLKSRSKQAVPSCLPRPVDHEITCAHEVYSISKFVVSLSSRAYSKWSHFFFSTPRNHGHIGLNNVIAHFYCDFLHSCHSCKS